MAAPKTRRCLWAFDFDGVICDSAGEVAKAAWRASFQAWPDLQRQWPDEPPREIVTGFGKIRPALETGWEAMLMLRVLMEKAGRGMGAPDPDKFAAEFSSKIKPALMERLGSQESDLATNFDAARQEWIAADRDGWLEANGFYPIARDAMVALIRSGRPASPDAAPARSHSPPDASAGAKPAAAAAAVATGTVTGAVPGAVPGAVMGIQWKHDVYLLTTKSKEFALELLAHGGVPLDADRVFGRGSGPKAETLQLLAAQDDYAAVFFVEDRLPALDSVAAAAIDFGAVVGVPPAPVRSGGGEKDAVAGAGEAAAVAAGAAAGAAAAKAAASACSSGGPLTWLCLAGWGYNTPGDREKARAMDNVVCLGSEQAFASFVQPFV